MTAIQTLTLSRDIHKAGKEILHIMDNLMDIYSRETRYLEDSNTQGFQSLQPQKMQHAKLYESAMQQMLARKEDMKAGLSETIKARIKAFQAEFTELATTNTALLKKMERATERLSTLIREEAKKAVAKRTSAGYGKTGKTAISPTRNMSIGINETA